jgi:hypothetical protein
MTAIVDITSHSSTHISVAFDAPYDRITAKFEALVPAIDWAPFGQLAAWPAAVELAEINAPYGLMSYGSINVTSVLALTPALRKCISYTVGNHVLSQPVAQSNPAALIGTRFEVIIFAADDGTARLSVELPSATIAGFGSDDDVVGQLLDEKLMAIIERLGAL